MSYVRVCDLCGRALPDHGCKKYRIRELRYFWTSEWRTIDAHDECVKRLLDAKRRGDGEDHLHDATKMMEESEP